MTAPETKPVTDTEVQTPETPETKPEQDTSKLVADDKPITKDEIEQPNAENNELTNTYNSLMTRWKNNDEEEKSYT